MRLYLDTAPVIYTVEQVPGYAATVDNTLSAPGVVLVGERSHVETERVEQENERLAAIVVKQERLLGEACAKEMKAT